MSGTPPSSGSLVGISPCEIFPRSPHYFASYLVGGHLDLVTLFEQRKIEETNANNFIIDKG